MDQDQLFNCRLPDSGPLNIKDWKVFLEKSRVSFDENFYKPFTHKETLSDFTQLSLLGVGAFGSVILIKNKNKDHYLAMKVMEKAIIVRTRQVEGTKNEKLILQSVNSPFTVYLVYFFKDTTFIYMVMPFIPGGELFCYLQKIKRCDENQAKFYVSQMILALEYLHFMNLIYRDLKPENILIDQTGYLKMTDFGFCKRMVKPRVYTICGTPEYMAPEIILSKGYSRAADWWAIGVFTYELVAGFSPFYTPDTMKLYEKITSVDYKIPSTFSPELKDLVQNVFQLNLTKRYGNMKNGINDLKNHSWFKTINWMAIVNRRVIPKYQPQVCEPGDTGNFVSSTWSQPNLERVDKYAEDFADF